MSSECCLHDVKIWTHIGKDSACLISKYQTNFDDSTGVYTKNFRFQISVPGSATVTRRFVIFLRHSKNNIGILPQIMTHSCLPYQFQFHAQWHARHSTVTSHSMTSWQRKKLHKRNFPRLNVWGSIPCRGRDFSSPPRPDQFRAHPTSYAMDTRSSFHRVKETEREADH
jgi:hypothetical protein